MGKPITPILFQDMVWVYWLLLEMVMGYAYIPIKEEVDKGKMTQQKWRNLRSAGTQDCTDIHPWRLHDLVIKLLKERRASKVKKQACKMEWAGLKEREGNLQAAKTRSYCM
jgi:hypothetical protein